MITLEDIVDKLKSKNYIVYTQPERLNVVGIRTNNTTSTTFDDYIAFFYYDNNGNLKGKIAPATTDPSVYFLENPLAEAPLGTAILKSGQYSYQIGLHRQKYLALVQKEPVVVIRDNDRNSLLNFFATTEEGMFGINIHRSSYGKADVLKIDQDSAGCQVFQNISDFDEMMVLAQRSKDLYGNNFKYTLLDDMDTTKKARNYLTIGLIFVGIGVGLYFYNKKNKIF